MGSNLIVHRWRHPALIQTATSDRWGSQLLVKCGQECHTTEWQAGECIGSAHQSLLRHGAYRVFELLGFSMCRTLQSIEINPSEELRKRNQDPLECLWSIGG